MAFTLPNNMKVLLAPLGTAASFTTASNASECVLSFAANPTLAVNDYVEVTSGWQELNATIKRVSNVAGSGPYLVTLEDTDTTDTFVFPAGAGDNGSVKKVGTQTLVTQIKDSAKSGGEPKNITWSTLDSDIEFSESTGFTAVKYDINLYDDITSAGYQFLRAATQSASINYGCFFQFKNGQIMVFSTKPSLASEPSLTKDEPISSLLSLTLNGKSTRYAS